MNKFIQSTISIILVFLLTAISVNAVLLENIKCVGDIHIQVNSIQGSGNYTFTNCESKDDKKFEWVCKCITPPEVINTLNESSVLALRLQYNIDTPKPIKDSNGTLPSNTEIHNQQLERIETRTVDTNIIPVLDEPVESEFLPDDFTVFITAILVVSLFAVFLVLVIILFFMNTKRFKRWLGVDENKPMTTWEIIVAIFSRKSIPRQTTKGAQQEVRTIKKEITTNTDSKYEDEVNDLLKDL